MQKLYHISRSVYRKRDRGLKCEVLFKRGSNEQAISTSRDQFYYFNSFYRNYWTVNFNSKFIGEEKKHTHLLTLENVAHILCKASWKLDCVMLFHFLSRFSTVRDEYEFIHDESMSIICVVQYFTIPSVH